MHPEISEDEAEDRLQEAIQEKFVVFGDVWIYFSAILLHIMQLFWMDLVGNTF